MIKTQKIDLLLSFYIASLVCSELLGSKVFTLFHINASVAIFIYPFTFAIDDMVTEVYGKDRARSFVQSGFFVLVFLFGFTLLSTILPPAARFISHNKEYVDIFSTSLRIIIASLISFWLSERFDIYLFSKIRERFGKKQLWFRVNISNIISEFVDTLLFMFLAFYVPGGFGYILSLSIPYWLLKCSMSALQTPITYVGVSWLRKGESG